ncbi:MAG TPA: hypothetical protein VD883_04555, partial [Candidatus Omnitrophota bacterium]|nr:hypothetical protein [Candidatus Omnitrophota bacterium]
MALPSDRPNIAKRAFYVILFEKNGPARYAKKAEAFYLSFLKGESAEFFKDTLAYYRQYFDSYRLDPAWPRKLDQRSGARLADPKAIPTDEEALQALVEALNSGYLNNIKLPPLTIGEYTKLIDLEIFNDMIRIAETFDNPYKKDQELRIRQSLHAANSRIGKMGLSLVFDPNDEESPFSIMQLSPQGARLAGEGRIKEFIEKYPIVLSLIPIVFITSALILGYLGEREKRAISDSPRTSARAEKKARRSPVSTQDQVPDIEDFSLTTVYFREGDIVQTLIIEKRGDQIAFRTQTDTELLSVKSTTLFNKKTGELEYSIRDGESSRFDPNRQALDQLDFHNQQVIQLDIIFLTKKALPGSLSQYQILSPERQKIIWAMRYLDQWKSMVRPRGMFESNSKGARLAQADDPKGRAIKELETDLQKKSERLSRLKDLIERSNKHLSEAQDPDTQEKWGALIDTYIAKRSTAEKEVQEARNQLRAARGSGKSGASLAEGARLAGTQARLGEVTLLEERVVPVSSGFGNEAVVLEGVNLMTVDYSQPPIAEDLARVTAARSDMSSQMEVWQAFDAAWAGLFNETATIFPSATLTRADLTRLRTVPGFLQTTGSISADGGIVERVERGIRFVYATGVLDGWVQGGLRFDDSGASRDLSGYPQLVLGLKGDSSEAFFVLEDTSGRRAEVRLSGIGPDEQVFSIPAASFSGIDLKNVAFAGVAVKGVYERGTLDLYDVPVEITVTGKRDHYNVGDEVSLQIVDANPQPGSFVRAVSVWYPDWRTSNNTYHKLPSYPEPFIENGILTWKPESHLARPGIYRLELQRVWDQGNGRIETVTEEVPLIFLPDKAMASAEIKRAGAVFETIFGNGNLNLPDADSPLWNVTIGETVDSKLHRNWGFGQSREAMIFKSAADYRGVPVTVEFAVDPITRAQLEAMVWFGEKMGVGLLARSEVTDPGILGSFFNRQDNDLELTAIVDGVQRVSRSWQDGFLKDSDRMLAAQGIAERMIEAANDGRRPDLTVFQGGRSLWVGPIEIAAYGFKSPYLRSIFDLGVKVINEAWSAFPEWLRGSMTVFSQSHPLLMVITRQFSEVPEFNELIVSNENILGLAFNPYAGDLLGVSASRWIGPGVDRALGPRSAVGKFLDTFVHTVRHEFAHFEDMIGLTVEQRQELHDQWRAVYGSLRKYQGTYAGIGVFSEWLAEVLTFKDDAGRPVSYKPRWINQNYPYDWAKLIRYDRDTASLLGRIFGPDQAEPLRPTLNPDAERAGAIRRLLASSLSDAGIEAVVRTVPGTVHNREGVNGTTKAVFKVK